MGGILRLFIVMLFASWVHTDTSVFDVAGVNSLYASLGYPPISRWVDQGGDPCGDGWQGVVCDNGVITAITLLNFNLGGTLGEGLGSFRGLRILIPRGPVVSESLASTQRSQTRGSTRSEVMGGGILRLFVVILFAYLVHADGTVSDAINLVNVELLLVKQEQGKGCKGCSSTLKNAEFGRYRTILNITISTM